jgi:uncharacterized metal-binding protein YceD (DUF177 family)
LHTQPLLHVADLDHNHPTDFELRPARDVLDALAGDLGLLGLRKLRLSGQVQAQGRSDWLLTARLGATVVQPCVATLDPVTTRIDADLRRLYLADFTQPDAPEVEMPEDDSTEPLPRTIDLAAVMAEALALSLPLYPRIAEADLGEAVFTRPGTRPMRDQDARPFAGLAGLRDRLEDDS